MKTSNAVSRIKDNLQELFKAKLASGDAYIRIQITSDMTALLSMEQVQESLVIDTEKITSLPSMPELAIGIMSSRNRVFCVFDLAQLLALPYSLGSPRQYQVIVLQTIEEQPIYIGLAVTRLQGMVRLPVEKIQSSLDAFPSELASYLSGAVIEEETVIPILEFNSIFKVLAQVN